MSENPPAEERLSKAPRPGQFVEIDIQPSAAESHVKINGEAVPCRAITFRVEGRLMVLELELWVMRMKYPVHVIAEIKEVNP